MGLRALGFDSAIDRVIAVGDLIDRGPGMLDGLKLLGEPCFFSVEGNHEQLLINAYRESSQACYSFHGAVWWVTIADELKGMVIEKLESLPNAIEIQSARGLVGVVHADVPAGLSWQEFVWSLDNAQIEEIALWGRERVVKHYRDGLQGIWRVCTGHTWTPRPMRRGSFLALDCTGGGDGPLAIYCVQEDVIYLDGRPVVGADRILIQRSKPYQRQQPEETRAIRAEVRAFAERVLRPRAHTLNTALERRDGFPRELFDLMSEAGLYAIPWSFSTARQFWSGKLWSAQGRCCASAICRSL